MAKNKPKFAHSSIKGLNTRFRKLSKPNRKLAIFLIEMISQRIERLYKKQK